MFGFLASFLYKCCWKRLLRLITGKCELVRICERFPLGTARTVEIERCLKSSKSEVLRRLIDSPDVDVHSSVQEVLDIKNIPAEKFSQFSQAFGVCLTQIVGTSKLLREVNSMKAEKYSESNPQHEKELLELWELLMPDRALTNRHSEQWKEIGFQGNNPATDFRGMGILGLRNLCYFAKKHTSVARQLVSHSNHPRLGYSFAVIGINLTSLLIDLLESRSLRVHFYNMAIGGDPNIDLFHEAYCYVFTEFDSYWREKRPENLLAFPRIRDELYTLLKTRLESDTKTSFVLDSS